ncbi:hypothetical protein CEXT_95841 [Caerostris extrusa]|uniref:Uncharacterized protein n=1 Tax=Caerostris extrusa TaxID=172846 RepID=A0AAV4RCJ5_CAEEX|nr:hypothetical protein CEXT_95841 [Caerostris extrusa]
MFKGRDKIRRYSIKNTKLFISHNREELLTIIVTAFLQDTMVVGGYKNVRHAAVRMERKEWHDGRGAAYHHRSCVLQDTMVVGGYKNVQHAARITAYRVACCRLQKWMFKGRDKIRRYSIKIRSFLSRTIGGAAHHHRNCVLQDTMVVRGYKNVQHAAVRMERKKNGMMGVERT